MKLKCGSDSKFTSSKSHTIYFKTLTQLEHLQSPSRTLSKLSIWSTSSNSPSSRAQALWQQQLNKFSLSSLPLLKSRHSSSNTFSPQVWAQQQQQQQHLLLPLFLSLGMAAAATATSPSLLESMHSDSSSNILSTPSPSFLGLGTAAAMPLPPSSQV